MADDRKVLCVPGAFCDGSPVWTRGGWQALDNLLARAEFLPKAMVDPPADAVWPARIVAAAWKQVIPYAVILDHAGRSLLAYRRKSREPGLDGKWSIGFGGHVEPADVQGRRGRQAWLVAARERELFEEILQPQALIYRYRHLGVLNDESDEVGTRHLGVVAVAFVDRAGIRSDPSEVAEWEWTTPAELVDRELESWSRILLTHPAAICDLAIAARKAAAAAAAVPAP